jgi:hypothetical protein
MQRARRRQKQLPTADNADSLIHADKIKTFESLFTKIIAHFTGFVVMPSRAPRQNKSGELPAREAPFAIVSADVLPQTVLFSANSCS